MRWRAKSTYAVEIQISLENQGMGWFWLTRDVDGQVQDVRRLDANDADGDASYQITAQQIADWGSAPLYLRIRVMGARDNAPVVMQVSQQNVVLECQDAGLNTINADKSGDFAAVTLGTVNAGQSVAFEFQIWF